MSLSVQFFKFKWLILLLFFFVAAQLYKLNFMAPAPEYIWDNVYLWDWARNVSLGNFSALVVDSHHQLRWGDWAFAAVLIQLFSDQVLYYYLATALPSIAAGCIFIYFAWKHIGDWQALLFAVLWFYDSELFRATFQLLPTGQSLLPIAILLMLVSKVGAERKINTSMAVIISLCIFWLYGVKETYLAFAPAATWIMWRAGGVRPLVILSLVMVTGYVGETLMFHLMNPDFSMLGRLHALIDGGQHVTIMLENDHYVGQQTRYFDSGVTMRWVAAVGVSSIVYFPAFIFAVIMLAQRSRDSESSYSALQIVSLMLLSFMFFTTFFVISISPLRLGHGVVSRYLAISLPFCYLLILGFVSAQLHGARLGYKLAAVAVIPFLISPAINRFADYPTIGVSEISSRYDEFGEQFKQFDCIRARAKSIVRNQLDMIPLNSRTSQTNALINQTEPVYQKPWFLVTGGVSECKNTYTITRVETARY